MFSSDPIVMADLGLCLEADSYDGQSIPNWNVVQAPQVQQVQWPQAEQSFIWENATETPVYQPDLNQCQYAAHPSQDPQFLQNLQYNIMNTPIQFQQPIGSQIPVRNNQIQFNRGSSHRAQITIVQTPSGTSKAIIKRKRKRTAFTTEQILALEQVFCKKPYVNRDDRQALVEKLQVSDRAVKVWFQNRRIKSKREEMEAMSSSDYSPLAGSDSSDSFGLAYVEAQMSQKTDEFGYVTLDDRAIGELVNVIDTLVSDNLRFGVVSEEEVVENVLDMEYEPISPAATTDSSEEEAANWRPPEPEQSLRQLLDMQHFC